MVQLKETGMDAQQETTFKNLPSAHQLSDKVTIKFNGNTIPNCEVFNILFYKESTKYSVFIYTEVEGKPCYTYVEKVEEVFVEGGGKEVLPSSLPSKFKHGDMVAFLGHKFEVCCVIFSNGQTSYDLQIQGNDMHIIEGVGESNLTAWQEWEQKNFTLKQLAFAYEDAQENDYVTEECDEDLQGCAPHEIAGMIIRHINNL